MVNIARLGTTFEIHCSKTMNIKKIGSLDTFCVIFTANSLERVAWLLA